MAASTQDPRLNTSLGVFLVQQTSCRPSVLSTSPSTLRLRNSSKTAQMLQRQQVQRQFTGKR